MLPSEKSERWVRRILFAALIPMVFYLLFWLVRFITPIWRGAIQQRQPPPEAALHLIRAG